MPRPVNSSRALFFVLTILAFYAFSPAYAYAQTSDEEAQRLKASFQELLDYQKFTNEAFGTLSIEYDGELTVERQSEYYTLTFPHIYLSGMEKSGADPAATQVFDIGVISLNAMADDKPGYWKIVLTLPEKMTVYNAAKGLEDPEAFAITIGEQRSIAYYSEKLGYFTKMDINISGLDFLVGENETGVKLGGVQIYTKLEEGENGTFSGPGHFLVNNLHVSPPGQETVVDMDEIKLSFSLGDFVLPSLKEYKQKIEKHKETLGKLYALDNQGEEDAAEPDINPQNVFNMIYDMYTFNMDSFSFAYSAKNVNIKAPRANGCIKLTPEEQEECEKNNSSTPGFDTMHIENGRFGAGITGLKTDAGALRIEWSYDGFKTQPDNPEVSDFVPQNLNASIEAQKVPYSTLGGLATNTLQSIAQNPESMQIAGLGIVMRLPAIIAQAGTQVVVDKNNISNQLYDIALDGSLATDLSSMTGFALKMNVLFEGLESVLKAAQTHSANTKTEETDEYQDLISKLEKLKSIGQKTTGKNSKPAYSFDIELNQQAEITINGVRADTVFSEE